MSECVCVGVARHTAVPGEPGLPRHEHRGAALLGVPDRGVPEDVKQPQQLDCQHQSACGKHGHHAKKTPVP